MTLDIQWPLVFFSLLAGVGGTLACSAGVAQLLGKAKEGRFVALVVSLVLLVLGGFASVLHLALPLNAFYAVTNIFSFSGISVELMMLGITFVVVLAYAILLKRAADNETALKIFAILSILSGLVLAFVCGHGYVIEARANWDTNLLPLAYLGSVLPAGTFLYLAIAAKLNASMEDIASLKAYVIASVVISIVTSVAYVLFVGTDAAMREPLASVGFIGVCGVIGELIVLACYLRAKSPSAVFAIALVGCILALLCAVGVRMEMWVASDAFFNAFYWEIENGTPIGKDDY